MLEWLAGREPRMPEALELAVRKAVMEAETAGAIDVDARLPERLAQAGINALAGVMRVEADRARAAELLAADALLTYACEAAAEGGEADLEHITSRFGETRIGRLLEPADR